jgi:hypothetical protein
MKKILVLAALVFLGFNFSYAADTKVSDLAASTAMTTDDLVYVVDGSTSKKITFDNMQKSISKVDTSLATGLLKVTTTTGALSTAVSGTDIKTINNTSVLGSGNIAISATATAGGSDTQVQFNDGGTTIGGDAGLTYNKTTDTLTAGAFVGSSAADGDRKITLVNNSAATATASSDEIYFEGDVLKVNENGTEKTVVDSADTVNALGTSTSANLATLLSDESGTGVAAFTTSPVFTTPNIGVATATANIKGEPKHLRFTIMDPLVAQTKSAVICIVPKLDAAITVTNLEVTLDATTNEVAGDVKWADAFIGLANAAVIETFDTTSGVRSDASIASGAVAAGKAIYISFDSAPSTVIKVMSVDITYSYS